ncbi:hypothetical protein Tco_0605449 [Tanacetum coccineum]
MLDQPTKDYGDTLERQSEPQPTSPSSSTQGSGGNHEGQSSSDKSLSGNEGGNDTKLLNKKLKKKANLLSHTTGAWDERCIQKQRLAGKKSLKKQYALGIEEKENEGTVDQNEGRNATQTAPTTTPTIFGDDETIAQVLLNMSQAKAVSKDSKGEYEQKESEDINESERRLRCYAQDDEIARKVQEDVKQKK